MLRIVVARSGVDEHEQGALAVARALRDAGHEVVYTSTGEAAEQVVETALQEDADLVGLSVPPGAHLAWFQRVVDLLAQRDAADIGVFGAGAVPDEDLAALEAMGVLRIFTATATTREIADWVREYEQVT